MPGPVCPDPRTCRIAAPALSRPNERRVDRQEDPDMTGKQHRRPSWDHVERGVKLALRIASEVVRLIIEIRGGR